MSANGFDQWAAADFDSHTDPVAADQAFAFVGDGECGFGQAERAVNSVRKAFKLIPKPLLRHDLPHLAILQVLSGQVGQVSDKPECAFLLDGFPVRIHQDFDQADILLVNHNRGQDQSELCGVAGVWHPFHNCP